ncbi:sensor histidine kinase [Methylocystis bryophila]|uniref:sensor histidine kinase n=1 Tax=Methylocystis bryophila TaxID=655015 RepID=UPI001FD97D4E|nr:PAS domain S-box protein [Methylocystis bryophila]
MDLLKEDDELFRLTIEAAPAAIIVADVEGRIRFANAEAVRVFGYEATELVGMPLNSLIPQNLRNHHTQLHRDFFRNPSKRAMGLGRDLRAVRRGGTEFPVEIGLTPIETVSETFVLATVLDISARREAEAALARRASELERANERLAQFAYVASHDLQEPLRKIAAFADFLDQAIEKSDRGEMSRAKDVIRSSALRARELVDDLLFYSRTINDVVTFDALDLRDEINLALEDLSQLISETGSEIDNRAPHLKFEADRMQFASLMQNIVSNAIKYRKPGETAKVLILVDPLEEGGARISIVDNGIGFETKYATMVFEPFKRLHSNAKYPGTGIGLAICKSIADRHGWSLSIESEPGKGATFFITIPRLTNGSRQEEPRAKDPGDKA